MVRRREIERLRRMDKAFFRAYRSDAWISDSRRCTYCRTILTKADVTGDHLVPRSSGGRNHRKNIKAACADCNSLKGSMSEKRFRKLLRQTPQKSTSKAWLYAHLRYRLCSRGERAVKKIKKYVGLRQ